MISVDPKPPPRVKRLTTWPERRSKWVETPYMAWTRAQPCRIAALLGHSRDCVEPRVPDHHPTRGSQGKFHERVWTLCTWHHAEKEIGVETFLAKYGWTVADLERHIAEQRKQYETNQ